MIIYKATNFINGKIYIGQTVRVLEERIKEHKRKTNSLLGKALNKYGLKNFSFQTIDRSDSIEELNEKETYWISYYKSLVPNGYNQCEGGGNTKGYNHRKDTRIKMSKLKQGKYNGRENPFYGKKHNQSAKQRMSNARIGRVLTEEWKRKIGEASKKKVINLDTMEIFDSVYSAGKHYGVAGNKISYACNGRNKTSCGFRWMYLDDYELVKDSLNLKPLSDFLSDVKKSQMKIAGHNKRKVINLNTLEVFLSQGEAAVSCGLKSSTSIVNACKKKTKTAGGFKWMYYDEYMATPSQAST